MKEMLSFLLALMLLLSPSMLVATAEEELPQYSFDFYGHVNFSNATTRDCQAIAENNGHKAEDKALGDSWTCYVYDVEIAGQQGVRVEFRGDPDYYGVVAQCAYFFSKADETVFDSLLELLLSIYGDPRYTEADGASYGVADMCYGVPTSGQAASGQKNAALCQRYAQWMGMDMDTNRPVLIDLSMMNDQKGTKPECVLRYTLLPEEKVMEETPASLTDGL